MILCIIFMVIALGLQHTSPLFHSLLRINTAALHVKAEPAGPQIPFTVPYATVIIRISSACITNPRHVLIFSLNTYFKENIPPQIFTLFNAHHSLIKT